MQKPTFLHVEKRPTSVHHDDGVAHSKNRTIGVEAELEDLPRGYYRSKYFIGSFLLRVWLSDARYIWIALVYNAVLTVFLAPVGRLSDIFGRRYFFIIGGVIGVVGSVICATARNIPVLIGVMVLLGISSATQLSWHFVIGELVPMKHRYFAHAFMYAFGYPGGGFGPAIGTAFFDYVGTLLFAAASVVFLLGLSWGGSVYPWKSAAVITSISGGGLTLVASGLWEAFAKLEEPLMPPHLFKSLRWIASLLLVSIAAGVYYAFAIIWPSQVAILYGNGNILWVGLVSSLLSIGIVTGQVVGGLVARRIGHTQMQSIVIFLLGGTFLACMAVSTPDNSKTIMALLFLGAFFVGWVETIALTNATLLVHDQREIGIAGSLATTARAFISAILQAVYTTILSNRLPVTIAAQVPSALVAVGLPASSIPQFLAALSAGTTTVTNSVPGITEAISTVGVRAYKMTNAEAYKTVYLSTIAFTVVGLVCAFFTTDMDEFMSDKVAATLANENNKLGRRLDMERKVVNE
ncbi:MFS general substrate transporter [Tothia fuscella]|uniref:MFS general substrate transporter n=1 Tax=Tothia fuscella TaxID=1048955 RepID=A0A9P4TWZ4_9PEZI|nr:MFS general substrate transporter [Tothia fuscella]